MTCRHLFLLSIIPFFLSPQLHAISTEDKHLQEEIVQLKKQTQLLQEQLERLEQKQTQPKRVVKHIHQPITPPIQSDLKKDVHNTPVYVHSINKHPESIDTYPAVLLAEDHVVTYIGGTPVITAPYLGSRPAFNGSDYIVNISSINRDIRLMQQRQQLYNAFTTMGYSTPNTPIVALSGKVEPIGTLGHDYFDQYAHNWDLGTAELDTAAAVNDYIQAYISLAYAPAASGVIGPRVTNSGIGLGMGFINIGDLNRTPLYFTAGQIFVPFGRYSTSLVSSTLPLALSRTKARPFILGYKAQDDNGPFAAVYGFEGDTTAGTSAVGGVNLGYIITTSYSKAEIGISGTSSIDNAGGMQLNGASPSTNTFGGFSSFSNGSEIVKNIPAIDVHGYIRIYHYIFTAEWVSTTESFRTQDLSYDGMGAKPQAGQLEAAATFTAFTKPASLAIGYQWSGQALALRLPQQRIAAAFSLSIWKDTIETLEYRHDIDYGSNHYANGAAPAGVVNANTVGTGKGSDTVLAMIGVYF